MTSRLRALARAHAGSATSLVVLAIAANAILGRVGTFDLGFDDECYLLDAGLGLPTRPLPPAEYGALYAVWYRLLGAFEQTTDEQVGQNLIAHLKTTPALTALRADAIKTRLAKYSPSVQEAAQPLYAALNVDLGKQRQQLEEMLASLPPGDIVRGQKVFHNEKAACKACHALGYLGGKTGPDLTRIGGIRNERDLLESILFPNASFVRSFEPVLIVTTNGKTVNGLIRSETPDELVIATGPNKEERVARADIEEMRPSSISIMPPGLEKQITLEQLADLIAFLKNCK